MKILRLIFLAAFPLAALCLYSAFFIVDESEQAVVTRFGKDVAVFREPGLHVKAPLIHKARMLEKGILRWDSGPVEVETRDAVPLKVEVTARWRIEDPQRFIHALGSYGQAYAKMDDAVVPLLKSHVAANGISEVIRSGAAESPVSDQAQEPPAVRGAELCGPVVVGRDGIEASVCRDASKGMAMCGTRLLDVRFRRIDFSPRVHAQVYSRMTAERRAAALRLLSEGEGKKSEINGRMEKELKEIMSASVRKAEEIRGRADAEAAAVYAAAYRQDPEFYAFFKTLETYRQTSFDNTELILGTDTDFYRYLKGSSK